jgi:hypothetical protein
MKNLLTCVAIIVGTSLALHVVPSLSASAEVVQVSPSKDNTLYESPSGGFSNGAGQHFFAGKTLTDEIRRALIAFPIAENIPDGAVIVEASLTLFMSRTITGPRVNTLHRVLADWGEGDSDATGEEGIGAPPAPGDATWIHTFYDTDFWTLPGGDFLGTETASQVVDQNGFYTWSSDSMVLDVQMWLDNPEENFGWIILGDESSIVTAKRFDTRENPEPSVRPVLEVEYALPPTPVKPSTWGRIKAIYN